MKANNDAMYERFKKRDYALTAVSDPKSDLVVGRNGFFNMTAGISCADKHSVVMRGVRVRMSGPAHRLLQREARELAQSGRPEVFIFKRIGPGQSTPLHAPLHEMLEVHR